MRNRIFGWIMTVGFVAGGGEVAAMSDAGYLIEKRELNGRTVTEVTRLDTDAKVDEISRLIGGDRKSTRLNSSHRT